MLSRRVESADGRGHQEVYAVLRGAVRFTLEDTELEAPAGTFVRVRAAIRRPAVATEADTIVLAPGREATFEPSDSEWIERVRPRVREHPEEAERIIDEFREPKPDAPGLLVGEALIRLGRGEEEQARAALARLLEQGPHLREAIRPTQTSGASSPSPSARSLSCHRVPLPKAIRARAPQRLRDHPSLRAVALGAGLIPPRPMHTAAEAALLRELAAEARQVVEIGVYEGSSAVMFCGVLAPEAELHLIDPFVDEHGWALRAGWRATPAATRLAVRRCARRGGPKIRWHIARSQDVGRAWSGPAVDLVFIDGDHSPEACREDWEVWHEHVRPGGSVAFHDARLGLPGGEGGPGPTAVVTELFRSGASPEGWRIVHEVDTMVIVRRQGAPDGASRSTRASSQPAA